MTKLRLVYAAAVLAFFSGPAVAQITANGAVTNNYIWRGLTQTTNEPAVQGGLDYGHESGFYIGTWVSNVQYASDDVFSYEHDVYFGFAGGDDITYDVGWLYYNYDDEAEFDFHELYGSIGYEGFSLTAYILTGTEADEIGDQDFGFGSTYYVSADYGWELSNGLGLSVHAGYHDGDFNEAFNGVPRSYVDYSFSISVKL